MDQRTETAHGYPILDRKASTIPGSEIVLVERDHGYHPFVVWRMEVETGICEGGQYLATLPEATTRFVQRH